jgi:NADH-quinone oxidoreductase subunit L
MNEQLINYALLILLLPIAAFVVIGLFKRWIPRSGDWIAIAAMGVALVLAIVILKAAVQGAASGKPLRAERSWAWLMLSRHQAPIAVRPRAPETTLHESGMLVPPPPTENAPPSTTTTNVALKGVTEDGRIRVGILLDGLTAVMLVVVTLVSFLVYLYSSAYMKGDIRYGRYYASLALFSASMLALVLSDNLFTLFMGWEMVGLCSYILIGHWYERREAANAALKAFITTRIGDLGMLIGILIIYWQVGSFRFDDVFAYVQAGGMSGEVSFLGLHGTWRFWAAIGLFFGAMGKSAQFPLHVWLPDAMEGPTPVSALIHAATMVAAGVYLVGRMHPFFPHEALVFVAYIGAITAVMSATIAVVMDDIKKVLAYSTISQLGYMMIGLGVGGPEHGVAIGFLFGLFHLTTHAFFKAGLFLGSGSVIHAAHHEQRMSQYGGLRRKLPVTFATFLIFTLALCGFPYLTSGFFTKDGIIAAAIEFGMVNGKHRILGIAALGSALLTSFYMFRLIFLTFTGEPRNRKLYDHAHESPWAMVLPLVILAVLSLGFVGSNSSFGLAGHESWFGKLVQRPSLADYAATATGAGAAAHAAEAGHAAIGEAAEVAHNAALAGSVIVFFAGLTIAWLLYGARLINPAFIADSVRPVYLFLLNKWYMDHLYHAVVVTPYVVWCYVVRLFDTYVIDGIVNLWATLGRAGAFLVGNVDNGVVDGAVNGTAWTTGFAGRVLRLTQTGKVRSYFLFIIAGVGTLVLLLLQR